MRTAHRWTWLDGRAAAALVVAALASAACGGDARVDGATPRAVPSATGPQATRPGPSSTARTSAASTDAAPCKQPGFRAAALVRINRARAMGADCRSGGRFAPARPLVWNDRLALAATQHSRDMSRHDFFSHIGSDGRDVSQRATAAGYPWASIGENIEAGHASLEEAVAGWMDSDPHCANIMAPAFTEMALACEPGGPGNTDATYWTLDLGRRR